MPLKLLSTLLLLILMQVASAYSPTRSSLYGSVFTRGLVVDGEGNPSYVVYDEEGKEIEFIAKVNTTEMRNAQVMGTVQANAINQHYLSLSADYPDAEVLTVQEYNALEKPDNKPELHPNNNYVVVRGEAQRLLMVDTSQLILQQSMINPDPKNPYTGVSLLVLKNGEIFKTSEGNIGLRASFLRTEDYKGVDDLGTSGYWKRKGYELVHPLKGLPVSTGSWVTGANKTLTDEDGFYRLRYAMFCPGFQFEFTYPVNVELKYARFNPRGSMLATYFFTTYKYDYCSGLSALFENSANPYEQMIGASISQIEQNIARPIIHRDIPIDIIILSGKAQFVDVGIGDETLYDDSKSNLERTAIEAKDFDKDGEIDKVATGKINITTTDSGEEKTFEELPVKDSELQGIWLSSQHNLSTLDITQTLPSYTRLLDWSDDYKHRALLSQINEDDLQNTDIYVIRESDGTLITERRGLNTDDYHYTSNLSTWDGQFTYTIPIVNNYEARNKFGFTSFTGLRRYGPNHESGFKAWQQVSNMNPKFYEREADHLRIGEKVKIVAINRATGYMGSITTAVKSGGSSGSSQLLSFDISNIIMEPPNLKVWAKRSSEVKYGANKGDRTQTIGNEGVGLSNDKSIIIYTEWLDHDGSPLPAVLADFGFTGRLAKITAPDTLTPRNGLSSNGTSLSNFAIKPGRQTQVIKLPENTLGEEHLYVHVNGQPPKRNPDFSTGSNYPEGSILKYRPKHFVPVRVPVADEKSTDESLAAWRIAKKDDASLKKPEPHYRWPYRPEFQVSIYDLEVKHINRTRNDGTVVDIKVSPTPVVSSTDSTLDLLLDLTVSDIPALEAYSYEGSRELVFNIGGIEIRATIGDDGKITLENPELLASLSPEDLLAIRLYANNDSSNILWEWAFEYLAIDTLQDIEEQVDDEGIIHVSADNPNLDLQALLFGYADRDPAKKEDMTLTWKVKGNGAVNPPHQINSTDGLFNTKLFMPSQAGSTATITAVLDNGAGKSEDILFGTVVVDPGKPAVINVTQSGTVGISRSQNMQVSGSVTDQYGNAVPDGTAISISVAGEALQTEGSDISLSGGSFETTITGSEFEGAGNTIEINVGDVTKTLNFDVAPLQLSIINSTPNHYVSETDMLTIQVLDEQGVAVANADVTVVTDAGLIKEDYLTTNSAGQVTVKIKNVPYVKTGKFAARVGFAGFVEQAYNVTTPDNAPPRTIDSKKALLVGDQETAGVFAHKRYDNANINMSYKIDATVDINGAASASKTLKLGNLSHPNIMPVVNYSMSRLSEDDNGVAKAPDENGSTHANIQAISVVQDHPLGAGHSYQFKPAGVFTLTKGATPSASDLKPFSDSDDTTMVFDVQFEQVNAPDDLIHFGKEGGQRVTLNPDNTLTYTVTTAQGQFQVSSEVLEPSVSHHVITEFSQGQVTLSIDSKRVSADAGDFILYRYPGEFIFTDSANVQLAEVQLRKKGSHLVNEQIDDLKLAQNAGFRLDVKIDQSSSSGQLIHFNSDAINVSLNSDNQVTYQITTDQGSYSLTSAPLNQGEWTTVAGRYQNGQLLLAINDTQQTTTASGNIQYHDIDQLKIGHHFNGKMTSLKFFDGSALPLVEFSNGTQQQTISLDGSGHKEITVKSTGRLNSTGTKLAMLSVAIVDENNQQGFINLVSTPLFKQLGGHYVDFIADDAPPIDTAYLNNPYQNKQVASTFGENLINGIITPAHAVDGQFFMDVGSEIWELINWIIPFEDIGILGKQLYYLGTDDPAYKPLELALSALGTLSIIPLPPTKALKGAVVAMRAGLKAVSKVNPKFLKVFASVVGRVAEKAFKPVFRYLKDSSWTTLLRNGKRGALERVNLDAIINVAPFIIIFGEMLGTEEGRTSLVTLVKSVKSDDDLFAWIDYLRLPTDGWTGSKLPPVKFSQLTPALDKGLPWYQTIVKNALLLTVSDTQAGALTNVTKKLSKVLKEATDIDPDDLIKGVKVSTDVATNINSKAARKLVHTSTLLRASSAVSATALKKIIRTGKKMRTNPILLIAAVAYLESRKECGENAIKINENCFKHTPEIYDKDEGIDKLAGLYRLSFSSKAFTSKEHGIAANIDGQFFHIVFWAYRHILYELEVGQQVLDVEQTFKDAIAPKTFMGSSNKKKAYYKHELDLVLAESPGVSEPYIGFELKSWAKGPLTRRKNARGYQPVKKWKVSSGSTAHKQFFLDRVALKEGTKLSDIKWRLQEFSFTSGANKGEDKSSPEEKDMNKLVRHKLAVLPSPEKKALRSLGFSSEAKALKEGKKEAKKILLFNVQNEIKDNAKDLIKGGIEEILTEFLQEN